MEQRPPGSLAWSSPPGARLLGMSEILRPARNDAESIATTTAQ